jgi:nicotinamidase/pyrazinamidase
MNTIPLAVGDALVVVDVQRDFLPGGALGVPHGDEVIAPLNACIRLFAEHALPIWFTRDWHPPEHCSFKPAGGIWPPHCVAGSPGAAFPDRLLVSPDARIVSKAIARETEAYSGFEHTDLASQLRAARITRLFIGGLATDYCVLNTVTDALRLGFEVRLLLDAIRAVDVHPGDGATAIREMLDQGARPAHTGCLDATTLGFVATHAAHA